MLSLADIKSASDRDIVADIRSRTNRTKVYRAILSEAKSRGLQGCDGCKGDGIYFGAGRVENGRFIGFTGKCFRCGGKGFQNREDRRRNWGYDNFHRRVSA